MKNEHLSNYLGGGFWQISERAVKVFGIEMALFITNLYDWREKLRSDGILPKDDFFYLKQNDIKKRTGLSEDKQRRFINILKIPKKGSQEKGLEILEIKRKGQPGQNFYRIDSLKLINYIETQIEINNDNIVSENTISRYCKTQYQDTVKHNNILNNNNFINNNKENSFSKEKESCSDEQHLSTVKISLETKTKLNRRTPEQIANSKQYLLQKTIPSLEQQKRKHLSDGIRQLSQPTPIPEDHLTEEMKAILNHWEGLGLKVSNKTTKTHKEGLKKLRRLFGGQLLFDKKYTVDEIQNSITRFSLAVKSKEYEPQDKKWLSSINLDGFIFNKHAKETSQFIKYLNKDEPKLAVQPLENLYPEIANKLKKRYFHDILGAINPVKLSQKDENNFIYASIRLIDYWIANKQKIYGEFSASEKADLLFDSVKNSAMGDLSIITPGWFCSDKTFSIRLSSWLQQKRITKVGVDSGIDSNEYNTNSYNEYIDKEENSVIINYKKEEPLYTEEDLADRLKRIKKKIIDNNCETHQINL